MNLQTILAGIDWQSNISSSLNYQNTLKKIDAAAHRVAVWSFQLGQQDEGNPALSFVTEMQHSIQHSGALIGLCLYKPSAAASRSFVESCIYYTYFRTHPEELVTLVHNEKYYMSKSDIIDYHKLHTSKFKERQQVLGLIGRLDTWYSQTSAIVHGQIPGTWNASNELAQTHFSSSVQRLALKTLLDGASIVDDLLLSTIGQQFWKSFSPEAKAFLIKGMSGSKRVALGLDAK